MDKIWQKNVKVRLNPFKKIPLNPPLIKGDLIFPSFEKGGVGGILKLKAFHTKITILYATYDSDLKLRGNAFLFDSLWICRR